MDGPAEKALNIVEDIKFKITDMEYKELLDGMMAMYKLSRAPAPAPCCPARWSRRQRARGEHRS